MDKRDRKAMNEEVNTVMCCGVLERMALGWMKREDGGKCMPHVKGHADTNMYRVNFCPSCGEYVRDLIAGRELPAR